MFQKGKMVVLTISLGRSYHIKNMVKIIGLHEEGIIFLKLVKILKSNILIFICF